MGEIQDLRERASLLPERPGCYLMQDSRKGVIYVGKAKNLKKRVSSYFLESSRVKSDLKTKTLVTHVVSFDFIITETEEEAFILENNLIKKYAPKYNIILKDDKSYPYVVVNIESEFPNLEYVRRVKKKKNHLIFGPFVLGSNIRAVIDAINKSFKLRSCSETQFNSCKKTKRPCLLFQLGQCSAPCISNISTDEYKERLMLALKIFTKRSKEAISFLEREMKHCSEKEEFERAAMLRDNLAILSDFTQLTTEQNVDFVDEKLDLDCIGISVNGGEVDVAIYMVRGGIVLGAKKFFFADESDDFDLVEELVVAKLIEYYTSTSDIPNEIVISEKEEGGIKISEGERERLHHSILKLSGISIRVCSPKK